MEMRLVVDSVAATLLASNPPKAPAFGRNKAVRLRHQSIDSDRVYGVGRITSGRE